MSSDSASTKEVFTVDEIVTRAAALAPVALRLNDQVANDNMAQADTVEWKEFGPFSTTAPMAKVLTHQYVILTPSEGYDNGAYICDIYAATANVTLPSDAHLIRAEATPEGYVIYQGDAKTAGTLIYGAFNESTYTIYTWSIVPKYDSLGHQLDGQPLPDELTDVTFSYFYLQPA